MKKTRKSKKSQSLGKTPKARQRSLHRRVSLHPATILLLLCIGVLMIGTTFKVSGAPAKLSMNITAASVEEPAIITKPADQERFKDPDIIVSGTCPNDSYIKIYKNDTFNGVAPCQSNKFEFTITLASGPNTLQVKVFNFSDQEGPASGSIKVYYDAPVTAVSPPAQTGKLPPQQKHSFPSEPLRIITDYKYKVHKSGQAVGLELALAGGIAPYAVAVYWNDDNISPIARLDRSSFSPEHIYKQKSRMYTYVIKVAASDPAGNSDFIQLMAVVDSNNSAGREYGGTTAPNTGTTNGGMRTLLKYMWPIYLIVVLMVLSFYLGEREEMRIMSRKNRKPLLR